MNSRVRVWSISASAVAMVAALLIGFWKTREHVPSSAPVPENLRTNTAKRELKQPLTPDPTIENQIRSVWKQLQVGSNPADAALRISALRDAIRKAPEEAAAAAIIRFLESRDDAPTGQPFTVGPDGMMDKVPSLRLALLDLLPSLDPLAALEIAREIMNEQTTPDEYAICLRNMAWNDLNGDLHSELTGRFLELLETPWLDHPSGGFLEAFDVAVELGGRRMFDRLVSLAQDTTAKSNVPASRATFISLDRMIVREPDLLKSVLSGDVGWMGFAPLQRASLISRLNLEDPDQRMHFLRYLTATPHGAGELEYFSKIFPNQNYLHGYRLVTAAEETPSIPQIAAADSHILVQLETMDAPGEAGATIKAIRDRLKKEAPSR